MSIDYSRKGNKMVEINFGISNYCRFAPGPWQESVMDIPETGKLPDISMSRMYIKDGAGNPRRVEIPNYSDVRANEYTTLPGIIFDLSERDNHILLIWIEERGGWIAVWKSWWMESSLYSDESHIGPYSLDAYCNSALMEAYKIPSERLGEQDISTISPSELEKIATMT